MNTQKGFVSVGILLAIIVGVMIVGGGTYYVMQQKEQPQTFSQDDISTLPTKQPTQQQKKTRTESTATAPRPTPSTSVAVNSSSAITITSPKSGDSVSVVNGTQVKWNFTDSSILKNYPPSTTYVVLDLISEDGKKVGSIGDGYTLSGQSANWNVLSALKQRFYTLDKGAKYKIQASLQYQPKFTCDPVKSVGKDCWPLYSPEDKALIDQSKKYTGETGWFTFDMTGYTAPGTIDKASQTITSSSQKITGTAANVSAVMLVVMTSTGNRLFDTQVSVNADGTWSYQPSLANGAYGVSIWTADGSTNLAYTDVIVAIH